MSIFCGVNFASRDHIPRCGIPFQGSIEVHKPFGISWEIVSGFHGQLVVKHAASATIQPNLELSEFWIWQADAPLQQGLINTVSIHGVNHVLKLPRDVRKGDFIGGRRWLNISNEAESASALRVDAYFVRNLYTGQYEHCDDLKTVSDALELEDVITIPLVVVMVSAAT